jgi:hypothetical protein
MAGRGHARRELVDARDAADGLELAASLELSDDEIDRLAE